MLVDIFLVWTHPACPSLDLREYRLTEMGRKKKSKPLIPFPLLGLQILTAEGRSHLFPMQSLEASLLSFSLSFTTGRL